MIFNMGAESGGSWNPALNELGAKNLLKNTLTDTTVNGVTFTVNEDGSVTANGTASAMISGGTRTDTIYLEQGEEYIISGGISSSKRVCIYYVPDYTVLNVFSQGSDYRFIVPVSGNYAVYCWIANGTTCNNDIFYPMLRHASISDDTYEPYAMTNKELTDSLQNRYSKTNLSTLIKTTTETTISTNIFDYDELELEYSDDSVVVGYGRTTPDELKTNGTYIVGEYLTSSSLQKCTLTYVSDESVTLKNGGSSYTSKLNGIKY